MISALASVSTNVPWLGTLCCVLGQDTLLPQCLFQPRCINGYLLKAGGRGDNPTLD